MRNAHTAWLMPHIPQQPHWTGLVRTGMETRPRLGNNAPSLTSTFRKTNKENITGPDTGHITRLTGQ